MPQELETEGKLPLCSSSLVNRNLQPPPGQCIQRCPFTFKTKFCINIQSKSGIFCFLGNLLISPLVKKQFEQAEEMERHRSSTLSAKAAYQSSGAWLGPEQPWGRMSCKDKQEKGHCRLLQACQSSRLPSRSSRLRDSLGVLCQDPSTEQCPTKPRSHWRKQSIFFKMQFLDLASSASWLYTKTRLPIFATLGKIFVFSTVKTFLTFPCIPHSYHSAEAVCENGKCHRHSSSASLIFPVDLAIIANNTGRAQ